MLEETGQRLDCGACGPLPRPGPSRGLACSRNSSCPASAGLCSSCPRERQLAGARLSCGVGSGPDGGPRLPTRRPFCEWFRASRCSVRKASVLGCEPALESLGERVWAGRGENWPYPSLPVGISKSSTESAPGGAFSVVAPDHTGAQGDQEVPGPRLSISPAPAPSVSVGGGSSTIAEWRGWTVWLVQPRSLTVCLWVGKLASPTADSRPASTPCF